MKITEQEVRHVARLAHLQVDDSACEKLATQIGKILEYVDALDQVDTTDVTPTSHAIELVNAFREDVLGGHLDREKALSNAPEQTEGAFSVPKVIG
jgi:aspartyl-tRNA(Asn)/glutamyl-tRNA(Gln) amidotransferase subunit C